MYKNNEQNQHNKKGKLITLEGIDGAGKTTIYEHLKEHSLLQNAIFTREPSFTGFRDEIEKAIHENSDPIAITFLYLADRAQHQANVIQQAIDEGYIIISDRHCDSNIAYQSALLDNRMLDPINWIKNLHNPWAIKPDKTIYFDVEPTEAIKRCQTRNEEHKYEKLDFLNSVSENFQKIINSDPDRFIIIDANENLENMKKETGIAIQKSILMQTA